MIRLTPEATKREVVEVTRLILIERRWCSDQMEPSDVGCYGIRGRIRRETGLIQPLHDAHCKGDQCRGRVVLYRAISVVVAQLLYTE